MNIRELPREEWTHAEATRGYRRVYLMDHYDCVIQQRGNRKFYAAECQTGPPEPKTLAGPFDTLELAYAAMRLLL